MFGHGGGDNIRPSAVRIGHTYPMWADLKDVLDRLLAGSTDYESLRADVWKQSHPEAVRQYRTDERRDQADRQRFRRARRRTPDQAGDA